MYVFSVTLIRSLLRPPVSRAHGCCCEQLVSVIYSLGGMNYQTDTLLFQKEKKDL
jgi:hypothetical protein